MDLAALRRSRSIEQLAADVLTANDSKFPPVDVCAIARAEGILLAESDYGDRFYGRIEYHRSVNRLLLFHPPLVENSFNRPHIRFSIAHELGHYYIREHRQLLLTGREHSSQPGFICENALEREADEFAAALLIPDPVLLNAFTRQNSLSIGSISRLGDSCEVSIIATAIRAVRFSDESALAVLWKDSRVIFAVASEEAKERRFSWIGLDSPPIGSATSKVFDGKHLLKYSEGAILATCWFPKASPRMNVWEEAQRLGASTFALTLLILDEEDEED